MNGDRMPAIPIALILVGITGGLAIAICLLLARRIRAIGEDNTLPEAKPRPRSDPLHVPTDELPEAARS